MIWVYFFYMFLVFNLKDFIFMSDFLILDRYSMLMVSIFPLVFCSIILMMSSYVSTMEHYAYSFYFFVIIFFVSFSFYSSNIYFFLMSLEMCVWPMIFLIYNFSKDEDKISSLIFMFLINIFGSVPFMSFYLCTLIYNFQINFMSEVLVLFSQNLLYIFFLLVLLCKFPVFLSHFWLVKAHVSASGSCSMILASLMLKLGTFGFLKFSDMFIFESFKFMPYIFSLSLVGSSIIMLVMIRFFDMKNLIACSSILHMSMIFPLVSMMKGPGVTGSLFMMVGHGLVSLMLFYLITVIYEISLNRSFDLNKSSESFSKTLSFLLIFFLFLNLGIPPFVNFFSELYFILVFYTYSFFSLGYLFFLMIMPILFVMFFSTQNLFMKKISTMFLDYSAKIFFSSLSYIFFLTLVPFMI